MSGGFDPLVPRDLDRPAAVPLDEDVRSGPIAVALDLAKIFAAPEDDADLPAWRRQLHAWREGAIERHGTGARYNDPASAWASSCFVVAQVWLWDELFFDFERQVFTPERFVADAIERFGGVDAVVLWHAYPVIGIDDRNQWDFYEVPGLQEAAVALRDLGVRVFVDYNPWDVGTRRGGTDVDELAAVIERLGADGVFLDTLREADPDFVAALDAARPGIGLEGESRLDTARIADHTLSWAQWFADSPTPGVLRARWFERRHQQHHVRRWHRDHAEELRSAWLNGVGVMVWEVVFGAWVGWNPRDSATLRRMLPVQRGLHRWLVAGEWTPLAVREGSVSGSTFELDGATLLVLANTAPDAATIDLGSDADGRWVVLHDPTADPASITVPGGGIAAAVRLEGGRDHSDLETRLDAIVAQLAEHPVETDAAFPHRLARRLSPEAPSFTALGPLAADRSAVECVRVPAGEHVITVRYRQRETGMVDGAPYVDEWKPLPPRLHDQRTLERVVSIPTPVVVGASEVTELEYAEFCAVTGFDDGQWHPRGAAASAEAPATSVTLSGARAYAAWCGGRLPDDDEWQLAASLPGFERRSPAVWNWTESEHSDGRTRFVMLKGGAEHRSEGSDWYFDGGVREPDFSAKLLLPGLGVDASTSVGFRICWEVEA